MYFLRTVVSNFDAAQRQTRKVFENMQAHNKSQQATTSLNMRYNKS